MYSLLVTINSNSSITTDPLSIVDGLVTQIMQLSETLRVVELQILVDQIIRFGMSLSTHAYSAHNVPISLVLVCAC